MSEDNLQTRLMKKMFDKGRTEGKKDIIEKIINRLTKTMNGIMTMTLDEEVEHQIKSIEGYLKYLKELKEETIE